MSIATAVAWCALAAFGPQAKAGSNGPVITLETAIARAIVAAPSLRSSNAELRGAEAAIRQAGVGPNPKINLDTEDFFGSGDFSGFSRSETTLALSKRLERRSKRHARVSLAESSHEIARLTRERKRLDVILAAQKAYIEVMAASAGHTNVRNRYRIALDFEKAVLKRVQAALDSAAAGQRIVLQTLESQTNLDQAKRAVLLAKRQLSMLWGRKATVYRVRAGQLYRINGIGVLPNGFPRERVPDIALSVAEQNKAEAAIDLELARARQDLTISLGVRHKAESDDVAAVMSFSIPLALSDTNQGNIDRTIAERSRADWADVNTRQIFDRRIAKLVDMLKATRSEALVIRGKMIPKAKQGLKTTQEGYERSAFTYLEVLDAQRTLRDLQAREISTLKKFHLAKAELDRLTAKFHAPFPGEEQQK